MRLATAALTSRTLSENAKTRAHDSLLFQQSHRRVERLAPRVDWVPPLSDADKMPNGNPCRRVWRCSLSELHATQKLHKTRVAAIREKRFAPPRVHCMHDLSDDRIHFPPPAF